MKRIICIITLCIMLFTSCNSFNYQPVDGSKIDFVQLKNVSDKTYTAVMSTTFGDITFTLFPEKAPKIVKNFVSLAKNGYYDGSYIFRIQSGIGLGAGSPNADGRRGKSIYGGQFSEDKSNDLWHFSGTISMFTDNANQTMDTRFIIVGDYSINEDDVKNMQEYAWPDTVIENYKKYGGVPPLDQNYKPFGIISDGMKTVNKIMALSVNEKTFTPKEDVIIKKITITKGLEKKQ